jgi:hypothetical protein
MQHCEAQRDVSVATWQTAVLRAGRPTEASSVFLAETFGRLQGASRTIYNDGSER